MNRIYQGRVTRVGILDGNNDEPPLLDEWPKKLWQHHELFQDAVNYYTLCLAAMSPDESDVVEQSRTRLGRFRSQVSQTWKNVTTDTTPFEGPAMQVGKWLGLPADKRSFNECAAKAFEGCEQSVRDLWKKMLADGSLGSEYASTDPWPTLLHAALEQALQRVQEMVGNKVALGTSELLPTLVNPKGDERRTPLGSKARTDKEKNFARLQHELYERPFPAAGQERQIRIRELRKNLPLGALVLFRAQILSPKEAQECLIEALDALDFAIQQKPSGSKRKHWFPLQIKDLESEDQLRARVNRWKEKVLKLTPDELKPNKNAEKSCQQYFAGSETEEQARARVKRWTENTMKLTADDLVLNANKKHSRWQYFAGLIFKLFPLLGDEADEMDSELAFRFLKDSVQAPGNASKERRLRSRLHSDLEGMPSDFEAFAADYDLDCIVGFGKKKYEPGKLQERLHLAIAKLRKAIESGKLNIPTGCDFNSTVTKMEQKIPSFRANFDVLVKAKDDVPDAWLCLRLDCNLLTWEFLKLVLPAEDKFAQFPKYRIKLARGMRGYIFAALI